jgi:hypothetical protein
MAKILKISARILGFILEWTLIFIILFAFAIRTSLVQTYLAGLATDFLSKELNTTIRIDEVSVVFIDKVAFDGVLVLDQQKDTLAHIERIYLSIDKIDLNKNKINFGKAELEKGNIRISRDRVYGDYNYWFITDYFAGEKKSKKKKPFEVQLKELLLSDIHFRYDDFRKKYTDFGVDFNHIDLRNLSLEASNFYSKNGEFGFRLASLKAKEKSGFDLLRLNSDARISRTGIRLEDLNIQTPKSQIAAEKLHLLFNGIDDFQTFVDSVDFDAKLNQSRISMLDVSLFATALEGMDALIDIKGTVTQKIKNLKLKELELSTGKRTVIRGNFNLPDFREFDKAFFSEKVTYAYIDINDLQAFKLPKSSSVQRIQLDEYVNRLGYFQARDLKVDGFYSQFVVAADKITTKLGAVKIDNGIMFTTNEKNNSLMFERSEASTYDVKVEKFDLGSFLASSSFGEVDGIFFLSGEAFSTSDIHFTTLEGSVNRFDFLDYSYEDISVTEGTMIDKVLVAKVDIKDDNLNLKYDGFIDFNGDQHMKFNINLVEALLSNLNLTKVDSTLLSSNFSVDIYGKDPNYMRGTVTLDGIIYQEGDKLITVPEMTVNVVRDVVDDRFTIKSEVGDFTLVGKVDFSTVLSDFIGQFDKVFPGMINDISALKKSNGTKNTSRFTYDFTAKETDAFLSIFVPDLKIMPGTNLKGSYDGKSENFTMYLNSPKVNFQDMAFTGISFNQTLTGSDINADYRLAKFSYGDSIHLDDVHFTTNGKNNILNSVLTWNPNTKNASDIQWETTIVDNKQLNIVLDPSYFAINEMRWDVETQSDMTITTQDIHISKFKLSRKKQYISLDGCISRNDTDKLNMRLHEIDLNEVSAFIGSSVELKGTINGWGYLSNPYTNLTYMGDASITGLYINKEEVGDVFFQSQWNRASESVGLTGDLMYRGNQTFAFQGSYFTARERENLDVYLLFDHTDIQFANAFMDPDVISNIKGVLNGNLKVSGTPDAPKLEGRVDLAGGNTKVEMLGVNFGFDGQIIVDEYGFYINNMPVSDEEGSTGSLIGSVYHENYADWNFDVQINLEGDETENNDYIFSWAPSNKLPERFLVMNTPYKEGELYYGKAYGTGNVNIFGYSDNIEITVDMKTKRGTKINFPMYGSGELDEEESFIRFVNKDTTIAFIEPKIDFTGVELDLNFRVTPDAKLKIIFNEQLGDEITASGSGDISMKMDNLGDLSLDGTYKVKDGVYNFAMGPIKQPFFIQEGGTITWTGDPYNANLDLKTYYKVNASLAEISPNELQGTSNVNNQEVLCFLALTESLMKPSIGFNITSPKANETGKALLSRIVSDPDELNRQFFSLLLWRRFQPLKGTTAASSSGALDLVSNQINSMLAMVSKDYKLNVNLDADDLTGDNTMEFGVSKGFLDNRLIVTGSFGVESNTGGNDQNQNQLIGDVSVEYLLNENGTFRINIFNESNDYSIIADKNLGLFTQGAGLNYQEDYDNIENFMLIQYFLDIFRSKENKHIPIKRNRRQSPVPTNGEPISFIAPQPDDQKKN